MVRSGGWHRVYPGAPLLKRLRQQSDLGQSAALHETRNKDHWQGLHGGGPPALERQGAGALSTRRLSPCRQLEGPREDFTEGAEAAGLGLVSSGRAEALVHCYPSWASRLREAGSPHLASMRDVRCSALGSTGSFVQCTTYTPVHGSLVWEGEVPD